MKYSLIVLMFITAFGTGLMAQGGLDLATDGDGSPLDLNLNWRQSADQLAQDPTTNLFDFSMPHLRGNHPGVCCLFPHHHVELLEPAFTTRDQQELLRYGIEPGEDFTFETLQSLRRLSAHEIALLKHDGRLKTLIDNFHDLPEHFKRRRGVDRVAREMMIRSIRMNTSRGK